MMCFRNIILVTIAILVGLVGCGSVEEDWVVGVSDEAYWIVGVWEVDNINSREGTSTLTFSSDGTVVVINESRNKSSFPYTLYGDILTIEELYPTRKQWKIKIDSHDEECFIGTIIGLPVTMEYRRVK